MSRTTVLTRPSPQQALQSYLDALLTESVDSISQDEFEAAVLEERLRDTPVAQVEVAVTVPTAVAAVAEPVPVVAEQIVLDEPAVQVAPVTPPAGVPPLIEGGAPEWGQTPFECLLFDVAGLTLAVPLISLGSIHSLAGEELTPLFGQPDWFLGILPSNSGNLKVLDTARWVMGERYRDEFRSGLQYVISVQGYEWGLAVHQVSRSIQLDPKAVKWRSQRTQRPWLAGTVIEHMCALLDVSSLAGMIISGATRQAR
ncbi:chemotaxis protein CheW [Pseudomonas sp. ABC1]|uniref:CheW domain-containing protein n=1 Tax=Pseudomonas sp. ABC1 TaxID=2748080 RepID=UPI0015C2DAD6|nr:CheW domain-containing protein [Pseudomonas sp. ABC1]QLF94542.1 chemotaxis protein CheW [Pseudomonas sp. ABC1]